MKSHVSFFAVIIFGLILSIQPKLIASTSKSSASKSNRLTNEPAGIISFEKPIFDFGAVSRGTKLSAKFNFQNIGKGILTIQGVQAPCDCTTVETSKGKTYGPGESGVLEVLFDTKDYAGKVTKAVTVITNERSMPDRTLTITALVNSDVEAFPPLADFGEVVLPQAPKTKILLKNRMKMGLKIEKLRFNEDNLDVGYAKEGEDYAVYIQLKPTTPIGFLKETVWVKSNSPNLPELPIPVRATIRGQISVAPSYIEFGSIASSEKSARTLTLNARENFEVLDHSVEMNVNGLKYEEGKSVLKVSITPGDKFSKKILLEVQNPGKKPGSVHGKIVLTTNNPQHKNLSFDFYAFFR